MVTDKNTTTAPALDPRISIECWIAMNESGDYATGFDEELAATALIEHQGGCRIRTVKLAALMAPPETVEVAVTVPDAAGHTVDVRSDDDDTGEHSVDPRQTD